jgi:RNA polymerase sigma-B factor
LSTALADCVPVARASDPESGADLLVQQHLSLARRVATRYMGRGEPLDDLVQVAMLGLVKAAQRYDPTRGTEFAAYAVPTMLGELRRHFRDSCWAVRVPRGLQEMTLRVQTTVDRLARSLGRSPTTNEVAVELDVTEDEVLEALEANWAYSTTSLDAPSNAGGGDGPTVGDRIGEVESSLDDIEARESVQRVLARLPERERRILVLRFFGNRTQREIADELGISQMHVSRLLARTLTRLRDHLVDEVPLPQDWVERSRWSPHVAGGGG